MASRYPMNGITRDEDAELQLALQLSKLEILNANSNNYNYLDQLNIATEKSKLEYISSIKKRVFDIMSKFDVPKELHELSVSLSFCLFLRRR